MLKARVIIVVLFLLFSVTNSRSEDARPRKRSPPPPPSFPPPPPPTPAFDLFVLALTWPGSFCVVNTCGPNVAATFRKFTLHGLWPTNNTGAHPRDCGTTGINLKNPQFVSLKTQLEINWPDLTESAAIPNLYIFFWDKQWKAHGTCSSMGQYDYFDQALKIHANKDLLVILQSNNIQPGGNQIQYQDVFNAISNGIGKRPQIICKMNNNKNYIMEIRLCLDKSKVIGKSIDNIYIDCPFGPPANQQCPPAVYLSY